VDQSSSFTFALADRKRPRGRWELSARSRQDMTCFPVHKGVGRRIAGWGTTMSRQRPWLLKAEEEEEEEEEDVCTAEKAPIAVEEGVGWEGVPIPGEKRETPPDVNF